MKRSLLILAIFTFITTAFSQSVEIQKATKIYTSPDMTSSGLLDLEVLDGITVIGTSDLDVVNNVIDNWYKVSYVVYDQVTWEVEKTIEGYVFGEYTSLKRSGQRVIKAVFDGCEMGDCYYITFGDLDFGNARNVDEFTAEFCSEYEGVTGNPKYVGKEFTLVINDLHTMDYEMCNPDSEPVLVTVPTIIKVIR